MDNTKPNQIWCAGSDGVITCMELVSSCSKKSLGEENDIISNVTSDSVNVKEEGIYKKDNNNDLELMIINNYRVFPYFVTSLAFYGKQHVVAGNSVG